MAEGEPSKGLAKPDTPRQRRLREDWNTLELQLSLRPFVDYAWENCDPEANASCVLDQARSVYRHASISISS